MIFYIPKCLCLKQGHFCFCFSPLKVIRYSIDTPYQVHRFDGPSMEYRWSIYGGIREEDRRKMGVARDLERIYNGLITDLKRRYKVLKSETERAKKSPYPMKSRERNGYSFISLFYWSDFNVCSNWADCTTSISIIYPCVATTTSID